MVFNGTTSGSQSSTASDLAAFITSFSIANKTGGNINVTVGIYYGSTITHILYNKVVATADSYIYAGNPIMLPANYQIYVSVSGSSDYYFTITGLD